MKKRILHIVAGLALASLATSCSFTVPRTASNQPIGSKTGVSESVVFAGIYFNGSYGIKDAAKKGKITGPISTVDENTTSFVIVKTKKLIVTGE